MDDALSRRPDVGVEDGTMDYRRRVGYRRIASAGYAAILVLLWAVPIAGITLLRTEAERAEQKALSLPGPRLATVGSQSDSLSTSVRITIGFSQPVLVKYPFAGTITNVPLQSGSVIVDGMPVLAIDGLPRVAQAGGTPIYRDLSRGDRGPDVARLRSLLTAVGAGPELGDSDEYDAGVSTAVKEFQRRIGVRATGTFERAYVVYIPDGFGVVAPVTARVGAQVANGEGFISSVPAITTVSIEPTDDRHTNLLSQAAPIVLKSGTHSARLTSSNVSSSSDRASLEALLDSVLPAAKSGVSMSSTSVVMEGVIAELATPPTYGVVPRRAVVTDRDGLSCVFALKTAGLSEGEAEPFVVPADLPASSGAGVALVPAELIARQVLLNPLSAGEPLCK